MKRHERRWLGTTDPYARLRKIESLDLDTRYREITQLFYADFQSTMLAKPFNGFMMNYTSPRIAAVLASTGELEHRVAKRVIDTTILASTVMIEGFTGAGREAARRVNAMHKHYDIHPDDFLAVGAEEALGSIELAERYGWRDVTPKEKQAVLMYYSQQTRAFGSARPLPETIAETQAFFDHYIDTQVRYDPQNERLARVMLGWIGNLAPALIRPLIGPLLLAQFDDRLARACGFRPMPGPIKALAHAVLRRIGAQDPIPDGAPNHLEALVRKVYPNGYRIGEVGTHVASTQPVAAQARVVPA